MKLVFPEFFKGLALTSAGVGITVHEMLMNGSLVLTCAGAGLAVLGGYWAFRTKREEFKVRTLEVRIKEEELRQLQRDNGSGGGL